MTDIERKQKLIENILNKFDKINAIRQEKEKQDFNPVLPSKGFIKIFTKLRKYKINSVFA